MNNFFKLNRILLQILFFFIFTPNISLNAVEKIYKGESLSNYFSGLIALNDNLYKESYNFLKDLEDLESSHSKYSKYYIETLINNSKINEAFRYATKIKKQKINFFQSDLIIITKLIKNEKFDKAYAILESWDVSKHNSLQDLVYKIIKGWVTTEKYSLDYDQAKEVFKFDTRYQNINKINDVFLNCYFDTPQTKFKFQNLIDDKSADFSRYTYFYVNKLLEKNLKKEATVILDQKLRKVPRNLLLNQLKLDLISEKRNHLKNNFDCKNVSHVVAELFYITANALSTRSIYSLSNYYVNLAKYLNQNFFSYSTLLAENFVMTGNYERAKEIYLIIKRSGESYSWHSSKQVALLELQNNKTKEALNVMQSSYNNLSNPNLYQTYDFASFLKNNEKFMKSIKYYSTVLNQISNSHNLYPKAKDGRGIAYERTNQWQKAEIDFLDSLKANPSQAYVINYLAYSWIEKGIKIEKSLKMLEKANELKSNDGYITDSLGWALYKLKRYDKAEIYLQKAVQLMPSDPIVNDHFADILWMNGKKIQARYYWEYVLNLKETESELKNKIYTKILNGPSSKISEN